MRSLLAWLRKDGSAIGPLRILLVLSIVGPVTLFAIAAAFTYRSAFRDADRMLARTSEVAREHAIKVFDSHNLIATRVEELIRGLDDDTISRLEEPLHNTLHELVAGLPQVQSVLIIGKDGHALVAADVFPVPRNIDFSDRDYFQALQANDIGTYVTKVMTRRIDGTPFFGLANRHNAADGSFAGVVDISISPDFFGRFYETLLGEDSSEQEGTTIFLVRVDGQVLAGSPLFAGAPPRFPPSSAFFDAISSNPEEGQFIGHSIIDSDSSERRCAYRHVPGRPLYVVAGQSKSSIISGWWWTMASHLMFGIPATIGLYAISLTALRRTQREQAALVQAREEIARREAAEDALRQAQKLEALGQLTAGVAHDFNNLLTVILGNLEFMARTHADDARTARRIDYMRNAAERGTKLTGQLLAFSRRQRLIPQPINLNAIVTGMGDMLRSTLGGTIRIETVLHPQLWPALVDRTQFELAVLNLAINARDALDVGGTLTIETTNVSMDSPTRPEDPPAGEYVMVSVNDDGRGMTAEVLARVFEPFFTTKEVGQGSGLGLSQVYGFARQSGGGVRIDSTLGEGTSVKLYLPRALTTSVETALPDLDKSQRAPRATILVVDDDTDVRVVTALMLTDLGHTVIEAGSGAAALDRLERGEAIDLALIDYAMPGMNGIETARRMRILRPQLPVMFITGYADRVVRQTQEVGDTTLQKPFTSADLATRIAALLSAAAGGSNVVSLRGS